MKNISPDVLERYLARKCTPEEKAQVDLWFKEFENKDEDPRIYNLHERIKLDAKMLEQIKSKINEATAATQDEESSKTTFTKNIYRVAVGIAAALVMGLLVYYFSNQPIERSGDISTLSIIRNTTGGITRHELADGTLIWLHPKSQLEFPNEFSGNRRELKLAGEAFFEVAKDSLRPFIVTTGNVITKVLGTSFNIKAYDEASSIEVAVLTGKVAVDINKSESKQASPSSAVLLTPNQRVTYIKEKNTLEKEEPKALPELSMWQATDVVFDNVPIKDVILTLNKKFGVDFRVSNNNLLNCLIRADFTNQNLPDILELLSKSVEASYEIKSNTVYLYGEGCVN